MKKKPAKKMKVGQSLTDKQLLRLAGPIETKLPKLPENPKQVRAENIARHLTKYLEHNAADHDLRLALLNSTRDENSCPQGLLNYAYSLVQLAQVVLENAQYASAWEDRQNQIYKGTEDETLSMLPFIMDFDKALQKARDEVAGSVPLE